MNYEVLHQQALSLSKTYRESEAALLSVLSLLLDENGFFSLGYPNLFTYCRTALGLSEAQSCYFSKVAKKSKEVPELKAAVEQGLITVSQARRVVPVISKETANVWIEKAALLPQRELEREVCAINPKAMPKEKMKPVSAERSELRVGISTELETKLRRVKEILGQDKSLEEVLSQMTDFYLKHKDQVEKAKRVNAKRPSSRKVQTRPAAKRRALPANVKHEVNLRDGGKCQARLPNQQRCESTAWTEHHHITPKSHGGSDTTQNLITLCANHHRLSHQTDLHAYRARGWGRKWLRRHSAAPHQSNVK